MTSKQFERFGWDFVLGGSLGAVAKTVMAPLERVKILYQTNKSNPLVLSGHIAPYTSFSDCVTRVWREQGVRAFWRGNLVNCMRYAPQEGTALALNAFFKRTLPQFDSHTHFWSSFGVGLASGGVSGAIANTVCYPLDFARTRLASDVGKKRRFKGILDCIVSTVRQQGMAGLYTGWSVTVAGAFVYRAGVLGCFHQIQDAANPFVHDKGLRGVASSFAAILVARSCVIPMSYPFDTVRRRMMLQAEIPPRNRAYRSGLDCARKVIRKEGVRGLWAGLILELASGVHGALVIVGFDRFSLLLGV